MFSFAVRTFILHGPIIERPIFLWILLHDMHDLELARTQLFLMFVIIELLLA